MDDVDFVLGQYDDGKGVSKKGLTFVCDFLTSVTATAFLSQFLNQILLG